MIERANERTSERTAQCSFNSEVMEQESILNTDTTGRDRGGNKKNVDPDEKVTA